MIGRRSASLITKKVLFGPQHQIPIFSVRCAADVPDTIKRVGQVDAFPHEYPGMSYSFNWSLNGDGVTPLRGSAFRINKTLDLKVAGLELPKVHPLKVAPSDLSKIPEAGTDPLSFDTFDEVSQRTRDLLSLSDHLYCPEGHVPGTRTGVRFVTNAARLAPDLLAYLDRAPKKEPPINMPITTYILEGSTEEDFAGYAIEEAEVELPRVDDGLGYVRTYKEYVKYTEVRSVAAIVIVSQKADLQVIVAGIEACQRGLAADEIERAAKASAAEKEA